MDAQVMHFMVCSAVASTRYHDWTGKMRINKLHLRAAA